MSDPQVVLKTNYGDIVLTLYPGKAPKTVANFLNYARSGFYDGTIFHRVIPGFVVQGGGLEPGMYLKKTESPVENEAANGLKNEKFTLAAARLPDPHSAASQFFINLADNAALDYRSADAEGFGYCVFGRVAAGEDVVLSIGEAKTASRAGYDDVPVKDIVVGKAFVDEAGAGGG